MLFGRMVRQAPGELDPFRDEVPWHSTAWLFKRTADAIPISAMANWKGGRGTLMGRGEGTLHSAYMY